MISAKHLLLGSAAVLITATGAHAADLGLPVAPAVDYMQICSMPSGGSGFILPGSDVCFQIAGFARYQATMAGEAGGQWVTETPVAGAPSIFSFSPRNAGDDFQHVGTFEVTLDAQTMTEYGLFEVSFSSKAPAAATCRQAMSTFSLVV
ncbi:MAG: porin [Devosiaceae bacterium]|nr:porin [Devosiaceae bacterium MH13]